MFKIDRRRFLSISAASTATVAFGGRVSAAPLYRWRGIALGAAASITLRHVEAERLARAALAEISRLEDIFSLYRPQSVLMRLNATGRLENPPFELLEVLSLSATVHAATGGRFDPTVQPLWQLYATTYATGTAPDADAISSAVSRVGWRHVSASPSAIAFDRQGMALTLNGIAQGYIADRVAALLAGEGLTDVLVDTGEMKALGGHPDGGDWPVTFSASADLAGAPYGLRDLALASSAPRGTVFDADGEVGHIIDPRTGQPTAADWQLVSVTAPSAALADALTTTMCLMDRREIGSTLAQFPTARLVQLA